MRRFDQDRRWHFLSALARASAGTIVAGVAWSIGYQILYIDSFPILNPPSTSESVQSAAVISLMVCVLGLIPVSIVAAILTGASRANMVRILLAAILVNLGAGVPLLFIAGFMPSALLLIPLGAIGMILALTTGVGSSAGSERAQTRWRDRQLSSSAYRRLSRDECDYLEGVLLRAGEGEWIEALGVAQVSPMSDGGMGSLRFRSSRPARRRLRQLATDDFSDVDGVPVTVEITVDQYGELFEVDVFKANFRPLFAWPTAPRP